MNELYRKLGNSLLIANSWTVFILRSHQQLNLRNRKRFKGFRNSTQFARRSNVPFDEEQTKSIQRKAKPRNSRLKPRTLNLMSNPWINLVVRTLPSTEAKAIAGGEGRNRRYKLAIAIIPVCRWRRFRLKWEEQTCAERFRDGFEEEELYELAEKRRQIRNVIGNAFDMYLRLTFPEDSH